ncbi:hypothetical protein COCCADRAFT_86608, partial [Bipolaris zeicola 26-R-13]
KRQRVRRSRTKALAVQSMALVFLGLGCGSPVVRWCDPTLADRGALFLGTPTSLG